MLNAKRRITTGLLVALAAAFSLQAGGCTKAGDSPGGPTGPPTRYNPDMDYSRAGLSARADRNLVPPGETFTILATFWDAENRPIEGGPVYVYPEAGPASAPYFSYATNPTITNAAGKVSILVAVALTAPPGSYTLVVATGPSVNDAFAKAYVHIRVPAIRGVYTVEVSGDTSLTQGDTASYLATGTSTAGCNPEVQFNFGAGWIADAGADLEESNTWGTVGTFNVRARARCTGPTTDWVESEPLEVTVAAP